MNIKKNLLININLMLFIEKKLFLTDKIFNILLQIQMKHIILFQK